MDLFDFNDFDFSFLKDCVPGTYHFNVKSDKDGCDIDYGFDDNCGGYSHFNTSGKDFNEAADKMLNEVIDYKKKLEKKEENEEFNIEDLTKEELIDLIVEYEASFEEMEEEIDYYETEISELRNDVDEYVNKYKNACKEIDCLNDIINKESYENERLRKLSSDKIIKLLMED